MPSNKETLFQDHICISYETLYNLRFENNYIPKQMEGQDFPSGVVSKALKTF